MDLGTALMVEPYDEPTDPKYPNGLRYFTTAELQQYVNERHRTTHTYLVHEDDDKRFAEIGMIADFQGGLESAATDHHLDAAYAPGQDLANTNALLTMLAGHRVYRAGTFTN